MALQSAYQQFLATSDPSLLSTDASLHYITTLTSINGSAAIAKHLRGQHNELKKKEEKFLDLVEGANALAVEVHTTIEFLIGGGAYLPNLDDNFLADRVVTFPIIHIVTFDADGKIVQIRQNWDQGSLLKLIDVIGKTGRNWPIRDGKDQIKLITSSVKSAGKPSVPSKSSNADEAFARSRGNSNNITRDPHASLNLFAPREKNPQGDLPIPGRSSAKPPPREYSELFVGGEADAPNSPSPNAALDQSSSPGKFDDGVTKAHYSKNYQPSRLFDRDPEDEEEPIHRAPSGNKSSEAVYRPNAKRYEHFDFANGSESQETTSRQPLKEVQASKHGSQWNFDDFNTPQKNIPSKVLRTNEVRHWGNSDDEVLDSPVKVKKVDKPRKDAKPHFDFEDDGIPEDNRRIVSRPRGQGANTGQGLYQNNLYDEENGGPSGDEPKQLKPIANVRDRSKTFDPQFAMTDDSPAAKPTAQRLPEDRAKAVKVIDANWNSYDQSPSQKENVSTSSLNSRGAYEQPKGINIAGDGMGGKKGSGAYEQSKGINISGDGMGGKKRSGPLSESTNMMSHRNDNPKGINVGGDGMGGKKGSSRQWGFGDDSDGEEAGGLNRPSKYKTGKTQGKTQATGGDFWDF